MFHSAEETLNRFFYAVDHYFSEKNSGNGKYYFLLKDFMERKESSSQIEMKKENSVFTNFSFQIHNFHTQQRINDTNSFFKRFEEFFIKFNDDQFKNALEDLEAVFLEIKEKYSN